MIEKIYPKFGCKFRHEEIIALLKMIQKNKWFRLEIERTDKNGVMGAFSG